MLTTVTLLRTQATWVVVYLSWIPNIPHLVSSEVLRVDRHDQMSACLGCDTNRATGASTHCLDVVLSPPQGAENHNNTTSYVMVDPMADRLVWEPPAPHAWHPYTPSPMLFILLYHQTPISKTGNLLRA